MKNSNSTALRIATGIYAAIYVWGFVVQPLLLGFPDDYTPVKYEMLTVSLCAGLFVFAWAMTFFNEKLAGILIMIWHFLVWVFALTLWPGAGMVLVLIFPMLFPAVLFIRNWELENSDDKSPRKQWKLVLQLMLTNYAAIYAFNVLGDFALRIFDIPLNTRVDELNSWTLDSPLGLSLIAAAIVFFMGAWASRRYELVAGILFIVWYAMILVLTYSFPVFANSGPSNAFGVTILAQGVLYIVYFLKFKRPLQVAT